MAYRGWRAVIRAPVVMMTVRQVPGREGTGESARWLRLARAEVEVNAAAVAHRHKADGNQRPQHQHGQHD